MARAYVQGPATAIPQAPGAAPSRRSARVETAVSAVAAVPRERSEDMVSPVTGLRGYIPELDGLRALAVALVLLFHLQLPWFSLGWTGVTLFFVISGFLITGILLDSRGKPGALRKFYVRRVLRIFPIYYLTIAVVVAWELIRGQDLTDLPVYLVYGQNYLLGLTNFQPNFSLMLNHTWSLAVEEQFYLFWALIVLSLSSRRLAAVVAGLVLLGPLSRAAIMLSLHNATLMDTALPAQVDALAVGAGLALLVRSKLDRRSLVAGAFWVAAVAGAVIFFLVQANGLDNFWHPENWALQPRDIPMYTLMALFWGGVLAVAALGRTILSPVLSFGALRHVGKISYGIYLYHFPVFFACDALLTGLPLHLDGLEVGVAKLLVTYLVALGSWEIVESRLLRLKSRFR